MDGKQLEIKALEAKSLELQALQQEKFAEAVELISLLGDAIEEVNLRLIELCR